jgi:hypothetical protein
MAQKKVKSTGKVINIVQSPNHPSHFLFQGLKKISWYSDDCTSFKKEEKTQQMTQKDQKKSKK